MKVPIFRAKDADSNDIVEGFYFNYPEVNNIMQTEEGENTEVVSSSIKHCILTYKPMKMEGAGGMMAMFAGGAPMQSPLNEPVGCNIDMKTLEFVRFEEVSCIGEE